MIIRKEIIKSRERTEWVEHCRLRMRSGVKIPGIQSWVARAATASPRMLEAGTGGTQRLYTLGVGRDLRGECTFLVRAEVLGMLRLHGNEPGKFQVLAGHVLIKKEEV